jgi:hypothetical protein
MLFVVKSQRGVLHQAIGILFILERVDGVFLSSHFLRDVRRKTREKLKVQQTAALFGDFCFCAVSPMLASGQDNLGIVFQ